MKKILSDKQCVNRLKKKFDNMYGGNDDHIEFDCDIEKENTYSWIYYIDDRRHELIIDRKSHTITYCGYTC